MRILTWQPMIQTEIGLPPTVVCLHTPPAVQRVYMRHRHGSSSCLSSGQRICLFSLTCHSETRWGRLEFTESVSSYRKSCMRLMTCFCDVLRWFSLKRLGVRCSSCVPSSGPCPWTAVLFWLCQIFLPRSRPRPAPPQLSCASWRRSSIASSPWVLILLSLPAWKPLCCSSQVGSYSFSYIYWLLNRQCK